MGFRTEQWVSQSPSLRATVKAALIKSVDTLIGGTPTTEQQQLIQAILRRPEDAAIVVTEKIVTVDGVDLDTADASITSAINTAATQDFMLWKLGIKQPSLS